MFAGNFAPNGWMFCEGQTLPIAENEVLFQLIGTTYGGDGETDLQPAQPCQPGAHSHGHRTGGTTYQLGEMAGVEQVTLTVQQIPNHTHTMLRQHIPGAALEPDRTDPRRGDRHGHLQRRHARRTRCPIRRSAHRAAASRTRTVSRSCASTSSSRCSGSSRRNLGDDQCQTNSSPRSGSSPFQLPAHGLGVLQRAAHADLSQNTALFSLLGHHLRRRRQVDLRAARPAGQRADAARPGTRALAARPRRTRRYESVTLLQSRNPAAHARAAGSVFDQRTHQSHERHYGAPGQRQCLRSRDRPAADGAACLPPVAGGSCRTTTCSRT